MRSTTRRRRRFPLSVAVACVLLMPSIAVGQALTGALVGTVKDEQGAVLPGALVRVTSPAVIGGPTTTTTNEKGQLRFPVLPPGPYRARDRAAGICQLSRGGCPHRSGGHARANGGLEAGRRCGIDHGGGIRIPHRSARQWGRNPIRTGVSQSHPDTTVQHVRRHQGPLPVVNVEVTRIRSLILQQKPPKLLTSC